MRRWNGWGDDATRYELPHAAGDVLAALLGPGAPPHDAALRDVVAGVPASRLPPHPLISPDALARLLHARGQSFPDLVAMRGNCVGAFPDGVSYPRDASEVRALLRYAADAGARVIPFGGGTSVVGHVTALPGDAPLLVVDTARMGRLQHLDAQSRLATFGAGAAGPSLEAQLRAHGFTLGHFPQSFEYSTLGGWVATRSSGQQSLGYGRIEQLFAGGRLEAPAGSLVLQPFPASAAGPDLREAVLGSEGRLGIVTEATVRVAPLPEREEFHAFFFPDWERALAAVRRAVQEAGALSMLRLSGPAETAMNLALAGHRRQVAALEALLALRGAGPEKCLLIAGLSGHAAAVRAGLRVALGVSQGERGIHLGQLLGRQWQRGRFRAPYLRNELWERGYAVDTVETSATWGQIPALVEAVEAALRTALAGRGERVHAFTHLSHVYPHGSSAYTTFVFRLGAAADETLDRWRALKVAASRAILAGGGTISHQHGVGRDHLPYLEAEKGSLGVAAIRQLAAAFDPAGLLNPGKLV
jgi:alkyldihydroxyacetonephosphate synthase